MKFFTNLRVNRKLQLAVVASISALLFIIGWNLESRELTSELPLDTNATAEIQQKVSAVKSARNDYFSAIGKDTGGAYDAYQEALLCEDSLDIQTEELKNLRANYQRLLSEIELREREVRIAQAVDQFTEIAQDKVAEVLPNQEIASLEKRVETARTNFENAGLSLKNCVETFQDAEKCEEATQIFLREKEGYLHEAYAVENLLEERKGQATKELQKLQDSAEASWYQFEKTTLSERLSAFFSSFQAQHLTASTTPIIPPAASISLDSEPMGTIFSLRWGGENYTFVKETAPVSNIKYKFYDPSGYGHANYYIEDGKVMQGSNTQIGTLEHYDTDLQYGYLKITATSGFLSGTKLGGVGFAVQNTELDPVLFSPKAGFASDLPSFLAQFQLQHGLSYDQIASLYGGGNGETFSGTEIATYINSVSPSNKPFASSTVPSGTIFSFRWDGKDYLFEEDSSTAGKYNIFGGSQSVKLNTNHYIQGNAVINNTTGATVGTVYYDNISGYGYIDVTATTGLLSGTALKKIGFAKQGSELDPVSFSQNAIASSNAVIYVLDFKNQHDHLSYDQIISLYSGPNGETYTGTAIKSQINAWLNTQNAPFDTSGDQFAVRLDGKNYVMKHSVNSIISFHVQSNGTKVKNLDFKVEGTKVTKNNQVIGIVHYDANADYGYFDLNGKIVGFGKENSKLNPTTFSKNFENTASNQRAQFISNFMSSNSVDYAQVASLYSDDQGKHLSAAQMQALVNTLTTGTVPFGTAGINFSMYFNGYEWLLIPDPSTSGNYTLERQVASLPKVTLELKNMKLYSGGSQVGSVNYDSSKNGYGFITIASGKATSYKLNNTNMLGFAIQGSDMDPVIFSNDVNSKSTYPDKAQAIYDVWQSTGLTVPEVASLYSMDDGTKFDPQDIEQFVLTQLSPAGDPGTSNGNTGDLGTSNGDPGTSSGDPSDSGASGATTSGCGEAATTTFASANELQNSDKLCAANYTLSIQPSSTTGSSTGDFEWKCTSSNNDEVTCTNNISVNPSGNVYNTPPPVNAYSPTKKSSTTPIIPPAASISLDSEAMGTIFSLRWGGENYTFVKETAPVSNIKYKFYNPSGYGYANYYIEDGKVMQGSNTQIGTLEHYDTDLQYGYLDITATSGFLSGTKLGGVGFAVQGTELDPVLFSPKAGFASDLPSFLAQFQQQHGLSYDQIASLYGGGNGETFSGTEIETYINAASPTNKPFASSNIPTGTIFSFRWDGKNYLFEEDPNTAGKYNIFSGSQSVKNNTNYYIQGDTVIDKISGATVGTAKYDTATGYGYIDVTATSGFLSGTVMKKIGFAETNSALDPVTFSEGAIAASDVAVYVLDFKSQHDYLSYDQIVSLFSGKNGETLDGTGVKQAIDAWLNSKDTPFDTSGDQFAVRLDGKDYVMKYSVNSIISLQVQADGSKIKNLDFKIEGKKVTKNNQVIGMVHYDASANADYGYFDLNGKIVGFGKENSKLNPTTFSKNFENTASNKRAQFISNFMSSNSVDYAQVASLYSDDQGKHLSADQMQALVNTLTTGTVPFGTAGINFSMYFNGYEWLLIPDPTSNGSYTLERQIANLPKVTLELKNMKLYSGNSQVGSVNYDSSKNGYGFITIASGKATSYKLNNTNMLGFAIQGSDMDPVIFSKNVHKESTDAGKAQVIYDFWQSTGLTVPEVASLYSKPDGSKLDPDEMEKFVVDNLGPIDGICGSASATNINPAKTTDPNKYTFDSHQDLNGAELCEEGTAKPGNFSVDEDTWTWVCEGIGTGKDSGSCEAYLTGGSSDDGDDGNNGDGGSSGGDGGVISGGGDDDDDDNLKKIGLGIAGAIGVGAVIDGIASEGSLIGGIGKAAENIIGGVFNGVSGIAGAANGVIGSVMGGVNKVTSALGLGNIFNTGGGSGVSNKIVFNGPGGSAGLQGFFRPAYKGNKHASAIGMITGWTNFVLPFVSVIAIAAIIYAGFLYLTALGNDEQVTKAKKIIIWVVIGIIVIFSAYAIVNTLLEESSVVPAEGTETGKDGGIGINVGGIDLQL